MSFTTTVKNEITQYALTKTEKIALLSAYFNVTAKLNNSKVTVATESAAIIRNIFKIVKDLYGITPIIRIKRQANFQKQHLYTLEIYDFDNYLTNDLGLFSKSSRSLIPPDYLISDEESLRAYLAGLFLAKGSINDPKTARYHLEITLDDHKQSKHILKLINEFNLNAKITTRNSHFIIYIKEAEKISDFLRIIHAYNAVMYFEDIRIYRDHKNMTNRLNNCEQANIDKMMASSETIISAINLIIQRDLFDLLPDKLKLTAEYKLKYPDTSIGELSEIITLETGKEVTKSGLNHRFRKIKELAHKLTETTP